MLFVEGLPGDLGALLDSPTVKYLLSIPEAELFSDLIDDAYKPKMHKMYSEFYNDVMVDFCLNVRKSPFPLDKMKEEVRALLSEREKVWHTDLIKRQVIDTELLAASCQRGCWLHWEGTTVCIMCYVFNFLAVTCLLRVSHLTSYRNHVLPLSGVQQSIGRQSQVLEGSAGFGKRSQEYEG